MGFIGEFLKKLKRKAGDLLGGIGRSAGLLPPAPRGLPPAPAGGRLMQAPPPQMPFMQKVGPALGPSMLGPRRPVEGMGLTPPPMRRPMLKAASQGTRFFEDGSGIIQYEDGSIRRIRNPYR